MKRFFKNLKLWLEKRLKSLLVIFLLLLIGAAFLYKSIVYTILPGEAGVRWRRFGGGTVVDFIYPEGMQIIPPFDKMYIYNVRFQEIHPELDVLTKTGLKVRLSLSIRYAPKYKLLGLLHQKIGPNYANIVIIAEIENVLREIMGTMEAEQVYTTGRAVIIEAINQAIERVAQRYINVDAVLIRKIDLPTSVADAIRFKIKQKHLVEAHEYIVKKKEKEAERKRVEGQGVHDQFSIVSKSLPEGEILRWLGIKATLELAKSQNTKVVVIGSPKTGLPIIGSIPLVDTGGSGLEGPVGNDVADVVEQIVKDSGADNAAGAKNENRGR